MTEKGTDASRSVKPNRGPAGPALPPSPPVPVFIAPPPVLAGPDLADAPLDLRLPIAVPPAQVPAIASIGLALSPYQAGPLYASTEQRQRSLWIELAEPIANPVGDALFARILAHGADPLLYLAEPEAPADSSPALSLVPELVRRQTHGSGRPLRVGGVQHPAPPLVCHAGRVPVPAAESAAYLPPSRPPRVRSSCSRFLHRLPVPASRPTPARQVS
jgi:hypothetical protein